MSKDYSDLFSYVLPKNQPEHYVNAAISVLSDIEFSAPDFHEEFLRSDIVLTISGVRAMSSDITFSSDIQDGRQTAQLKKVLLSHDIVLLTFGSEQVLINMGAFIDLGSRYTFANLPEVPTELTPDSFRRWITSLTYIIENELAPSFTDPIEPTDIWLGVLHGYPGSAITAYASKTPFLKKTDIENAEAHSGASVNYKVTKDTLTQESIEKHKNLWAKILKDSYLSINCGTS